MRGYMIDFSNVCIIIMLYLLPGILNNSFARKKTRKTSASFAICPATNLNGGQKDLIIM